MTMYTFSLTCQASRVAFSFHPLFSFRSRHNEPVKNLTYPRPGFGCVARSSKASLSSPLPPLRPELRERTRGGQR